MDDSLFTNKDDEDCGRGERDLISLSGAGGVRTYKKLSKELLKSHFAFPVKCEDFNFCR